ncbi:MAG: precorrin-4 C(11)-methyltransferase [Rhodospirillaceae bacterium TMED8]|nr:precorrin-4 C(11)-methyltransferase [Magnetovibrio sp.]OUT47794.1 MAG: precorrin-4 C(11)-methyltransferase [Rhodospirillaceae bacterium TMED8]
MTVHFIGAGPGAPDLITVRALNLIRQASVILYAGSLVPKAILAEASSGTEITDTASMDLDAIIGAIKSAHVKGQDVARVHSGDPSLYGAIAEQMRRLDALGISYDVTPGVPAYAAAAAAMKKELTLAGVSQSIILTRTAVRSSSIPPGEELAELGKIGATLAIHLSINNLAKVVRELSPHYGLDCPIAIAYRVGWPDELIIEGQLSDIRKKIKSTGITRTALILVGRVLKPDDFDDSRLYASDHHHILRPRSS